jgi:septal ring factor EnvC (AmiA/AmiB activator)
MEMRRASRVVTLRLTGRKEADDIRTDVTTTRTTALADEDSYQNLRDELVALTAEIRYLDGEVDGEVSDVSRQLLLLTKGDRKSPLYLAVFPSAPSEATRLVATDSQNEYVHAIVRAVAAQPEQAGIDTTRLVAAQAALEDALARRTVKRAELRVARAKRDGSLAAAILSHNQAYLRLQLLYPGEKALVRSFFYQKPSKAEQAEDEAAETSG